MRYFWSFGVLSLRVRVELTIPQYLRAFLSFALKSQPTTTAPEAPAPPWRAAGRANALYGLPWAIADMSQSAYPFWYEPHPAKFFDSGRRGYGALHSDISCLGLVIVVIGPRRVAGKCATHCGPLCPQCPLPAMHDISDGSPQQTDGRTGERSPDAPAEGRERDPSRGYKGEHAHACFT
jgi:hypothetical protein